ncbi:MAG: hypothetical protein Q8N53_12890 [Longimicrobiales bacterium]|nr:hypothetical protein [Longimicrobiales bacterium]
MSALARAQEHLRGGRRDIEAALSEVPEPYAWDLRQLAAETNAIRRRVQDIRHAIDDLDPEPPGTA